MLENLRFENKIVCLKNVDAFGVIRRACHFSDATCHFLDATCHFLDATRPTVTYSNTHVSSNSSHKT